MRSLIPCAALAVLVLGLAGCSKTSEVAAGPSSDALVSSDSAAASSAAADSATTTGASPSGGPVDTAQGNSPK